MTIRIDNNRNFSPPVFSPNPASVQAMDEATDALDRQSGLRGPGWERFAIPPDQVQEAVARLRDEAWQAELKGDERTAARLRFEADQLESGSVPGAVLNINADGREVILVGDLHGNVEGLQILLSQYGEGLRSGRTVLVFLGDAIHPNSAPFGEMDSSIEVLDNILRLKEMYPNNVFYARGNHDAVWGGGEEGFRKGGYVYQGVIFREQVAALRGPGYARTLQAFFDASPLVVTVSQGGRVVAVAGHSPVVQGGATMAQLISAGLNPNLVRQLTWNRPGEDYSAADLDLMRQALRVPSDTVIISGHTPHDDESISAWRPEGMPNHVVLQGDNPAAMSVARVAFGSVEVVDLTGRSGIAGTIATLAASGVEENFFNSRPIDLSNQDFGYLLKNNPSLFLPQEVYRYFQENGIEIKFEQQFQDGQDVYWLVGESERYSFQISVTRIDNQTLEISFINFVDHDLERGTIRNPGVTRTGFGGTEALISGARRAGFRRFVLSPVTQRLSRFYQNLGRRLGAEVSVNTQNDVIIDFTNVSRGDLHADFAGVPPLPLFVVGEPEGDPQPAAIGSSVLEKCGLTESQRMEIEQLMQTRNIQQIELAEGMQGQTVSYESLKRFLEELSPSETPRFLIIATPENFYSIGGGRVNLEGITLQVSGNIYQFRNEAGEVIASYELREGYNLVEVSNDGSDLARSLSRDISRQARSIEFKIIAPFYQKLISNQQFANRIANVLTEAGTLGVGLVGSHAVSAVLDEFGIQMPALRFVLEFGGFDLSARLFSRFMGLPSHGFAQGLPGLGQLHWGTTAYHLALDAFNVSQDSLLRGEIPSLAGGILATRALFNKYLINPNGVLGRVLARAGIYLMLNQVVTESGVWLANRLTNGQGGQIFDESSVIAATTHPLAYRIGSYTIGRVYTSMLIDLFTGAREEFEAMMADAANNAETAAIELKNMLSDVLITYCAAHPRSFGEVPEVPVIDFSGTATGTLDSSYYNGLLEAVRQAFADPKVQEIMAGIVSVHSQHYGANTMNQLVEYFDASGRLVDPEGLVAWLKSENAEVIRQIENTQKDLFAYEMFVRMAVGGDLTPYQNMGWIGVDGEPILEDEHVQAGLAMFIEEQRQALVERTAYLISRQSLGEKLEYNPLDNLLGITTFKDGQVVVNEESNPYLEEAKTLLVERGVGGLTIGRVVETVISAAAFADPQEVIAWLESLNIDQSSPVWAEVLSRGNLTDLARTQGHLGGSNLASKEAIGLYRMLYMYYLAQAPESPVLQIFEAYLPIIEGKDEFDSSWMVKAGSTYNQFVTIIENIRAGVNVEANLLRLKALCVKASLLSVG